MLTIPVVAPKYNLAFIQQKSFMKTLELSFYKQVLFEHE